VLVTFFFLVLMFSANPSLVPNHMKPNPVLDRGHSKPAARPTFGLWGSAGEPADSTSRADSLEAGTIDPESFTPEEFWKQRDRALRLYLDRKQFLDEINSLSDVPKGWT